MSATTLMPERPAAAATIEPVVHWPEVQRLTGKDKKTVKRWAEGGKFPKPLANWPGQEWVWSRADIRAFFARLQGEAAAATA